MEKDKKIVSMTEELTLFLTLVARKLKAEPRLASFHSDELHDDYHTEGELVDPEEQLFRFTHYPDEANPRPGLRRYRRWRFEMTADEILAEYTANLGEVFVAEDHYGSPEARNSGASDAAGEAVTRWQRLARRFLDEILKAELAELAVDDRSGGTDVVTALTNDLDPLLEKLLRAETLPARKQLAIEIADWLIEREEVAEVYGSDDQFLALIEEFQGEG